MATLAQLALQKSEIEVAIAWFEKQIQIAKGEAKITAALTHLEVREDVHATTRRLTRTLGLGLQSTTTIHPKLPPNGGTVDSDCTRDDILSSS